MSHSYVSNLMHCTFSTKERDEVRTGSGSDRVSARCARQNKVFHPTCPSDKVPQEMLDNPSSYFAWH
jgi:hypothetical protein